MDIYFFPQLPIVVGGIEYMDFRACMQQQLVCIICRLYTGTWEWNVLGRGRMYAQATCLCGNNNHRPSPCSLNRGTVSSPNWTSNCTIHWPLLNGSFSAAAPLIRLLITKDIGLKLPAFQPPSHAIS